MLCAYVRTYLVVVISRLEDFRGGVGESPASRSGELTVGELSGKSEI